MHLSRPCVAKKRRVSTNASFPEEHFGHSTLITRVAKRTDACVELAICPSRRDAEYPDIDLTHIEVERAPQGYLGGLAILLGVRCCSASPELPEFSEM